MRERAAVRVAAATATLLIAQQVAGKAARDTFFLGAFGVAALPVMFIAAAAASIAVVPLTSRLLARHGPARVVPLSFAASAALLLLQWTFAAAAPRLAAAMLYLHVAAINAVLISWFWSLLHERFDPRTARRGMRAIGGGAALGGLAGALIAERCLVLLGAPALMLVLAALHGACALGVRRLAGDVPAAAKPSDGPPPSTLRILRRSSYVRDLAALVVTGTVGAAIIDYLFKAQVLAANPGGPQLVRAFAIFYAATGLAGFLVQTLASPALLEKLGIARTVALLPLGSVVAAAGALAFPGLASLTLLRGADATLRGSSYRSGYELFFTPLPTREKRKVKALLDIVFDRLGDALGGAVLALVVAVAGAATRSVLLLVTVALSAVAVWIAARLHRGYIRTLERSLRAHEVDLSEVEVHDSTTLSVVVSLRGAPALGGGRAQAAPGPRPADPFLARLEALRSSDATAVRAALAAAPLDRCLVPQAIALLSWDAVAPHAQTALRAVAASAVGQLGDALLDPDESFAARRRLPGVLSEVDSPRAIDALLRGLDDPRFEVRYRCGRALARIRARAAEAAIDRERVLAAVRREATVDRGVWESRRLLDQTDGDDGEPGFIDDFLRDRASRSLEHVFTLLSVAFPRRPLQIAFRGLHTGDAMLRGTALEYLESALPADVRGPLWPFLEERPAAPREPRPREAALERLLRSNESIQLRLEDLRRELASAR